jgi:hypothetical protein
MPHGKCLMNEAEFQVSRENASQTISVLEVCVASIRHSTCSQREAAQAGLHSSSINPLKRWTPVAHICNPSCLED